MITIILLDSEFSKGCGPLIYISDLYIFVLHDSNTRGLQLKVLVIWLFQGK